MPPDPCFLIPDSLASSLAIAAFSPNRDLISSMSHRKTSDENERRCSLPSSGSERNQKTPERTTIGKALYFCWAEFMGQFAASDRGSTHQKRIASRVVAPTVCGRLWLLASAGSSHGVMNSG
jgi:hypothetical protein